MKNRSLPPIAQRPSRRSGFMLPLVLMVLALLIQIAYYLRSITTQSVTRSNAQTERVQASLAAEAGVRYAKMWLEHGGTSWSSPAGYPAWADRWSFGGAQEAGFQLLPAFPGRSVLDDESCRLNLNSLPLDPKQEKKARDILLHIPGMTIPIADAILDWIDQDDQVRQFGAERSYYSSRQLPGPRNGRIDRLEELLAVRGISPLLLHGNDRNGDSVVDQDEFSSPKALQAGWNRYLTVCAGESNRRADGSMKIYLNDRDASFVYDQLSAVISQEKALFIAALRRFGPSDDRFLEELAEEESELAQSAEDRLLEQLGEDQDDSGLEEPSQEEDLDEEDTLRQGIDLGGIPSFRIRSLADLCGTEVTVVADGDQKTLTSPWSADAAGVEAVYRDLHAVASTFLGTLIEGRLRIDGTPWQLLRTLPGIDDALAKRLERSRPRQTAGRTADHLVPLWLLRDGVLDWKMFRRLNPWITVSGSVYAIRSLGFSPMGKAKELQVVRIYLDRGESELQLVDRNPTNKSIPTLVTDRDKQ